ncbi:MAG TPA: VWA domain-containing protein [Pyrinomonadaceae bacterium]|nr:VWA domain-containing protein [Pyrinomonadaceae bacterium]
MFRLPDKARTGLGLLILCGALVPSPPASAGAQTARARQRRAQRPAARPSPSPTPAAPRLAPAQSPATVVITTDQPPPPPRVRPTPTPTPAPPPDDMSSDEDVVRVTSNLVVVPVSVTDAAGEAVTGLKLADFRLQEEGRAQELVAVGDAEQVPLDIALVFDVSSSVTKNFEFQKQSAAGFLKQVLKPIDRAAIFTIAERPQMAQPLASGAEALAGLSKLRAAEKATGTAFYDTVMAAARYLGANAPERNRRVILVVTDGEDNFSDDVRDVMLAEGQGGRTQAEAMEHQRALHARVVEKVSREVQRADAVFYSINPSGPGLRLNRISQRAQDNMERMAETTGGNSFVPARLEDLGSVFRRIAAELRAQYLLQYLSNADAPPGKFLRIKVTTPARPDLRIRARQGYYKKGAGG